MAPMAAPSAPVASIPSSTIRSMVTFNRLPAVLATRVIQSAEAWSGGIGETQSPKAACASRRPMITTQSRAPATRPTEAPATSPAPRRSRQVLTLLAARIPCPEADDDGGRQGSQAEVVDEEHAAQRLPEQEGSDDDCARDRAQGDGTPGVRGNGCHD